MQLKCFDSKQLAPLNLFIIMSELHCYQHEGKKIKMDFLKKPIEQ